MPIGTRWGRVATVAFLVVLMFPLTRLGCELVEFQARNYATYAEAQSDGAVERGWLAGFVPASALRIREVHSADTRAQWLVFDLPAGATGTMTSGMEPITLAEARRTGVNRPWRAGPGWPAELGRMITVAPRDSERLGLFRTGDGAFCLAVDRAENRTFAWRCDHAG